MEGVMVTREEVLRFLSIPGFGFGNGNGSGYGSGSGAGNGFGDGNGSGYGSGSGAGNGFGDGSGFGNGGGAGYSSGSGYGSGYGSGSGAGAGNGDGNGSGYGSGSGAGYGFGDGAGYGYGDIKEINGNIVDYIDGVPTVITHIKGAYACGYVLRDDLSFHPCFVAKAGRFFAHGDTLRQAYNDANAKELENTPLEVRIEKFKETFGALDTQHKGKEYYAWHHVLTGSCKMGRDSFCRTHHIDMDADYTVEYFLRLTLNSYGGDVIKQLCDSYGLII